MFTPNIPGEMLGCGGYYLILFWWRYLNQVVADMSD